MQIKIIQVLAIIFALFAASRVILRFRERTINWKSALLWVVIWLAAILVALFPNSTFTLSQYLGIQRGIDLIIYLSIIVLFYLVFRLYVKLDDLDKDMTKIVREVAIKKARKK